ncbi:unnamed protein product [Lactuca virosa]|uniref:Uncharacterized protein n=1 Tax=Lactuca virosa TaxID=75947 RepID=A0AAU9NNY7_9ASTR|nr:unnamed protein product [Lactuca virosa]
MRPKNHLPSLLQTPFSSLSTNMAVYVLDLASSILRIQDHSNFAPLLTRFRSSDFVNPINIALLQVESLVC